MNTEEHIKPSSKEQRREFIKTATKLSGIVALLGISPESFGAIISAPGEPVQDLDPRARAIRHLFTEAMDNGDMGAAINKHRREAQLTDTQIRALRSITKAELAALKSLGSKLEPLGISELAVMTAGVSPAAAVKYGPIPPYGEAIRKAIARGERQEMRNTAASARKWLADVQAALTELDSQIKKTG